MTVCNSPLPVWLIPLLDHWVYFVYQEGKVSVKTWADNNMMLRIWFSTPALQLLYL